MSAESRLTMLSDMASSDFLESLDRQVAWGIRDLDLRGGVFGHTVNDLPLEDARRAAEEIARRDLAVFSLSTGLLVGDITRPDDEVAAEADALLARALPVADILQPRYVRILGGQWPDRPAAPHAVERIIDERPWVIERYRAVAERISAAGHTPILENEATRCFLSHPCEMVQFLDAIDHPELRFTWDVENQWATGVFPTMAHLDQLAPRMSYFHLKGGKADGDPQVAAWNVGLEESTYPVVELTTAVVQRGLSEVICLNPTQHAADIPGYDYAGVPERDLAFLRAHVPGVR